MAEKKSVISQLQSVGEDALGKLTQTGDPLGAPGRDAAQGPRRQARSRGLEAVEKRLDGDREAARRARGQAKKPRRAAHAGEQAARRPRSADAAASDSRAGARSQELRRARGARSAPGTTSKRAGVVPRLSPSSSSGSGAAASTRRRALRTHLDPRVADVAAAVELR